MSVKRMTPVYPDAGHIQAPATLIADTTFTGNVATAGTTCNGGAFYLGDDVDLIERVVFRGNSCLAGSGAAVGGGMYFQGSSDLISAFTDCVFDGNLAASAGATAFGGGLHAESAIAVLERCATFTTSGYNWVGSGNCPLGGVGDVAGLDPGFRGLADHGCVILLPDGTCVPAVALDETSLALDWGSCAVSGAALDARAAVRPVDDPAAPNAADACDPGAFERQLVEPILTRLFLDGFESGSTNEWSATVP